MMGQMGWLPWSWFFQFSGYANSIMTVFFHDEYTTANYPMGALTVVTKEICAWIFDVFKRTNPTCESCCAYTYRL
jgi:hypothetical protein